MMEVLRLTALRSERGWSKAELARRANLNACTVGLIENGQMPRPYPSQLAKLATALGLPDAQGETLMERVSR